MADLEAKRRLVLSQRHRGIQNRAALPAGRAARRALSSCLFPSLPQAKDDAGQRPVLPPLPILKLDVHQTRFI